MLRVLRVVRVTLPQLFYHNFYAKLIKLSPYIFTRTFTLSTLRLANEGTEGSPKQLSNYFLLLYVPAVVSEHSTEASIH